MSGLQVYAAEVGVPARTYASLDSDNRATMSLLRGKVYRFCVVNRLGLGGTVDFWFPTTTCSGASFIIPSGAASATLGVTLAEQDLQAITVAADGMAFLNNFQLPIREPIIATGNQAGAVARFGNGFVVGLGGHDPGTLIASSGLDGLIGVLAPALFPVRAALNVDIVWPDGNPSRLVFAHEFGHHVFYQLLALFNAANPPRFAQHLLTIIGATIANAFPGPNEPAFQPMAINEGFADIISSQLAGGRTGFRPASGATIQVMAGEQVVTESRRPTAIQRRSNLAVSTSTCAGTRRRCSTACGTSPRSTMKRVASRLCCMT